MCRMSWKIWVLLLTLISITLLLLVAKLIYEKATRDKIKAEATTFVNYTETSLETEFVKSIRMKWENHRSQGGIEVAHNSRVNDSSKMTTMDDDSLSLNQLRVNVSRKSDWRRLVNNPNSTIGRKLRLMSTLPSTFLLPQSKEKSLREVVENITRIQAEEIEAIKVPLYTSVHLEKSPTYYSLPKFVTIFTPQSTPLLPSKWTTYLNTLGPRLRSPYSTYLKLINEEAALNKAYSATEQWISATFEISAPEFGRTLTRLWDKLYPFYVHLHAHLRGEIRLLWAESTPSDGIPNSNGTIPPNIFEHPSIPLEMSLLYQATKPYPGKPELNLTAELRRRRYTTASMATFVDDYLSSLGFLSRSPSFWSESIFRKPHGQPDFDCHPKLFQIDPTEFRISLCGKTNPKTMDALNQLMIQASLKSVLLNESILLREFGNPLMRESVSAALQMSMRSNAYYQRMGLLEEIEEGMMVTDLSNTLQRLYHEALDLFSQITKSLVFHFWNWDIYRKKIGSGEYNKSFWKLRTEYEGISPTESRDSIPGGLDAGMYSNLIQNPVDNIRPLVVAIMKYRIFHTLCLLTISPMDSNVNETMSNVNSPTNTLPKSNDHFRLENCDLSGSPLVGEHVASLIQKTLTASWRSSLDALGLNSELDPSSLLLYFDPLVQYLKETNKKREYPIGW